MNNSKLNNLTPNQILESFIEQISVKPDRETLKSLMQNEVLPTLQIHQSALFCVDENDLVQVCSIGLIEDQFPNPNDFQVLDQFAKSHTTAHLPDHLHWVQWVSPILLRETTIGFWLFGTKKPDNFFSKSDIKTIRALTKPIAIVLENIAQKEQIVNLQQGNIKRHEAERTKLARDLHDDILNGLIVLALYSDPKYETDQFRENYDELIIRIRQMIAGLRPKIFDQNLWGALDELVDNLRERSDAISIHFNIPESDVRYPDHFEDHLYRIVQQACENAFAHSGGENIYITGKIEQNRVEISIRDDGIGFSVEEQRQKQQKTGYKHYGLIGMQERTQILGGTLTITPDSPKGMLVSILVEDISDKYSDYLALLKTKKELVEVETNFEIVVEKANDGIVIVALDGSHLYVNDAYIAMTGYPKNELLTLGMRDMLAPKYISTLSEQLSHENSEAIPLKNVEIQLVKKNGSKFDAEASGGRITWKGQDAAIGIIRDITERKQIYNELKRGEANLRQVLEQASDGIVIADGNQNHLFANQKLAQITGYELAELYQIKTKQLIHPTKLDEFQDRIQKRLAAKPAQENYETLIITKTGESIPVEVAGNLITWQEKPAGMAVIRDISERKAAEEARRQNEADMIMLMDAANDGILITTTDEKQAYANPKIAEITGYPIPELLNMKARRLIHPDEYPNFLIRKQKRISGEIPQEKYQTKFWHKDGRAIPVEISGSLITWGGQPATLGLIRDLSDRQRTETDLRTVLDSTKDAIILTDPEGNNLYANRIMAELTGYSISELINIKAETLVPPAEYQMMLRRRDNRLKGSPEPEKYTSQIIHKDGHLIPVEIVSAFMHWQGKPAGIAFMRKIEAYQIAPH